MLSFVGNVGHGSVHVCAGEREEPAICTRHGARELRKRSRSPKTMMEIHIGETPGVGYLDPAIDPVGFQYSSKGWLSNLRNLPQSEIFFRIRSRLLSNFVVTCGITICDQLFHMPQFSSLPHTLLGSALGLLLVFRTDAAYTRFWEGRKQISALVQACRSLTRKAALYLSAEEDVRALQRLSVAFAYALRDTLTCRACNESLLAVLSPEELSILRTETHNPPLTVLLWLTSELRRIGLEPKDQRILELFKFEGIIEALETVLSSTERINTTPVPRAYARHTSRFLSLYCMTLPFAVVDDLGWTTIPAVVWACWGLFSIEELGTMIENPFAIQRRAFEDDRPQIPLNSICEKIRLDTEMILQSRSRHRYDRFQTGPRPAYAGIDGGLREKDDKNLRG